MKKKASHEKEPNHERWLVSYADFITLLFAVFVTLYAMGQTDKIKAKEVSASIGRSFGYIDWGQAQTPIPTNMVDPIDLRPIPPEEFETPPPPEGGLGKEPVAAEAEFAQIKQEINNVLLAKGAQEKVKLAVDSRGLVVSLKEAGFFDSGSATVRGSARPILEEVAKSIAGYANAIRIEGHTDNLPVKSALYPSNWELSTARATSIVHYLVESLHLPPTRLSATGYGEFRPIADNQDPAGRAKNRRVDIVLLSSAGAQGEPTPSGQAAPATPPPPAVPATP